MNLQSPHNSTDHDDANDLAVIRVVLSGDRNAFGALVERHGSRLHAILIQLLGNRTDAEDVMQEAFLRAYRNLPSFRGTSSFATWLIRIAINLCKNHFVRKKGRETVSLDVPTPLELAQQKDPWEELNRQDNVNRVRKALDELSENHKEILVLRDLQDCSYKEISRILNCPIGTVMSRLSHARRALAQQLGVDTRLVEGGK